MPNMFGGDQLDEYYDPVGHMERENSKPKEKSYILSDEEEQLLLKFRKEKEIEGWKPKLLSHYSDIQKIGWFDQEYEYALLILNQAIKNRYIESSGVDNSFKNMMNLLGPGLWDFLFKNGINFRGSLF